MRAGGLLYIDSVSCEPSVAVEKQDQRGARFSDFREHTVPARSFIGHMQAQCVTPELFSIGRWYCAVKAAVRAKVCGYKFRIASLWLKKNCCEDWVVVEPVEAHRRRGMSLPESRINYCLNLINTPRRDAYQLP